MKKLLSCSLVVLSLSALSSPLALAHGKPHACKAVKSACKTAGKKGADLKACVKTIRSGGTVEGVTIGDSDLKTCQGH